MAAVVNQLYTLRFVVSAFLQDDCIAGAGNTVHCGRTGWSSFRVHLSSEKRKRRVSSGTSTGVPVDNFDDSQRVDSKCISSCVRILQVNQGEYQKQKDVYIILVRVVVAVRTYVKRAEKMGNSGLCCTVPNLAAVRLFIRLRSYGLARFESRHVKIRNPTTHQFGLGLANPNS